MNPFVTNDQDFIKDFLIESYENLDKVDALLVRLEITPGSSETLDELFRAFHTIKGTSRMFAFEKVEALTHEGEDFLAKLRDGRLRFNAKIIDSLLAIADKTRALLGVIEKTGGETPPGAGPNSPPSNAPPSTVQPTEDDLSEEPAALADSTLRVDVAVMDRLMAQVGELVLSRNQIVQRAALDKNPRTQIATQRLNFITSELQGHVMKMRLQPIAALWNKMPRLVRDLSLRLGKEVRLNTTGAETELDKKVLESIKDPLTHLLRNALDHGIETPRERRARGKAPEGLVSLRAHHEGGVVKIEVADDGGGIDLAQIRRTAVEKQFITAEEAAGLDERETIKLLFRPGFSTASAVSKVSGRGVGLDVVKSNVEQIGGTIEVQTQLGHGTVFHLKIPLTLAILPALLVTLGSDRYAIPQASLLELIRLKSRAGGPSLEWIDGSAVFRLRGKLLPVIFLKQVLGGEPPAKDRADITLVVLQAGERAFGLVVDRVTDTEEIVVKPLGRHLKRVSVFEGATVLGDGKVALILDVAGLAHTAHVLAGTEESGFFTPASAAPEAAPAVEAFLIVRGPDDGRVALPLSRVARLEEFPATAIERAGPEEVIQYRGGLLRLVRLNSVLKERRGAPRRGAEPAPSSALQSVVVCGKEDRWLGILVEQILDISEEPLVARAAGKRPGVAATVVLRGRVTEILDVDSLLARADSVPAPGAGL
ncbi:MAG: chemotaxis protein CheW [Elusimicrobia bacterium]|nr:chemotaxis protein CheW [Elusimicrobiota bacterium]